jgi:hypothetical protein
MEPSSRESSHTERRELQMLAFLPLASAAALTLFLIGLGPRIWLFALIISTVCACISMFIGVVPLLLFFRRLGWRRWFHYAIAGFTGVLLIWLVPVLTLSGLERGMGSFTSQGMSGVWAAATEVLFLIVPAAIASVASVVFWFFCDRDRATRNAI